MAGISCTKCGAPSLPSDKFCTTCGAVLAAAKAATSPDQDPGRPTTSLPANSSAPVHQPSDSVPRQPHPSRWPVYAVVAVVLAALGVGAVWMSTASSKDETNVADNPQLNVDGGQEVAGDVAEQDVTKPVNLQDPGGAGVWAGEAFYPDAPRRQQDYEVTLRLEGRGDGAIDGQVRYRNSRTGVVGAWKVAGQDIDGAISVSPGNWIGRPDSQWSREGLELTQASDGTLTGSATDEYDDSSSGTVDLRLVAAASVDSDSIGRDWRAALVAPEPVALSMLNQMRQEQLKVRDSLDGYWVPQVSSGCQGLRTALGPMMASSILATHARAGQDYGAITVTWDDIGTEPPEACPNDTMWVALVPETFSKASGAKNWCTSNGFTGGSCAARYLVPRGKRGTDIEYLN